ncbi:Rpn family recombination-promoting nuclease/putative transposase [Ruminococcus sp. OM05-10BH]|nr:Rpn family recombination-promoting nuclease/putative transposase [Ruminococcus sp. OM05-10BH]
MDNKNSAGYIKTYDQLTVADNFLFRKIMQKPEICKQVLERILGRGLTNISYQESLLGMLVKDDENTYYALEMLQEGTKEIPKRARKYCSTIVQELVACGETYYNLSDVVVIFICPFDLFGAGRAKYVIREYEDSEQHLLYSDGCTRIIINTKGKADTEELQSFLNYLEGQKNTKDPLVRTLQKEEQLASKNAEWRADFIKLQAREIDQKEIRRQEGLKEGRKIARQEAIHSLLNNGFSVDEVKRLLKVSDEEISRLRK